MDRVVLIFYIGSQLIIFSGKCCVLIDIKLLIDCVFHKIVADPNLYFKRFVNTCKSNFLIYFLVNFFIFIIIIWNNFILKKLKTIF